jgi:hypothetical protein
MIEGTPQFRPDLKSTAHFQDGGEKEGGSTTPNPYPRPSPNPYPNPNPNPDPEPRP